MENNKENESPQIEGDKSKKNSTQKEKTHKQKKSASFNWGWSLKVLFLTLTLSIMFSTLSELVLTKSNIIISILVIVALLTIGTIFDMIGVAATSGEIDPFLAMASRKVRGAKESISIIKNASKVASFCCDIIGDICGILGGAAGASIVLKIITEQSTDATKILVSALVSGVIAALTVFLKSLGKEYAVKKSSNIILLVGKVLSIFTKK